MLNRLRSLGAVLFRRDRFEDAMRDELQFHIEAYADDLVAAGMPRAEAERRARGAVGGRGGGQGGGRRASRSAAASVSRRSAGKRAGCGYSTRSARTCGTPCDRWRRREPSPPRRL